LLQEVDPQHHRQIDARAPCFSLRIIRLDDLTQPLPGYDAVHLGEEHTALRRPRVTIEAGIRERNLLVAHRIQ
jgi:hypothetical protein